MRKTDFGRRRVEMDFRPNRIVDFGSKVKKTVVVK